MTTRGKHSCVLYISTSFEIVVIQNKNAIIESHKYNNIDSVAYFLTFVENFLKSKIEKIFLIQRRGVCH